MSEQFIPLKLEELSDKSLAILNNNFQKLYRVLRNIETGEGIPGTRIKDAAIVADKISSNAVTTDKINAGAVTAAKLTINDLADIKNLLTVAANVKVGGTVITGGFPGFVVTDGTYNRFEAGELSSGVYGTNIRDANGVSTVDEGELQSIWKKIYDNVLTSATTSITISGLHGDTSKFYKLVFYIVMGADTAAASGHHLRFNGDTGTNYGTVYTLSDDGTVSGGQFNATDHIYIDDFDAHQLGYVGYTTVDVYAKSGHERMAVVSTGNRATGSTMHRVCNLSGVWSNTTSEITELNFVAEDTNGFGAGTYIVVYERI